MSNKLNLAVLITAFFSFTACLPAQALAQQWQEEILRQELMQPPAPQDESEMQWVWGEVVSVDPTNKAIVVKCLDYETDQEREMTVNVDDKTVYDNVKSLDEIKPNDTLSIDYIISADNRNIARNLSKEAAEVIGESEAPAIPSEP
ncbi:MAG: hypothetical protein Q8O22_04695 [Candidatus Omnitrophota bacterium]|nr:hypothetical protein [Candidatus Omnitrophota bacterium]